MFGFTTPAARRHQELLAVLAVLSQKVQAMSQSTTAALAAINDKIAVLQADETAEVQALGNLAQAFAAAQQAASAQIAALTAQVAAGGTLDPTATLASLDAIDQGLKAATATAVAAIPAPPAA